MDIPRYNVLGVGVHAVNLASATSHLIESARAKQHGYVCCCDAHSLTQARANDAHRHALNHALLATPDGMPVVWAGQQSGHEDVNRTYGPDLLESLCAATADSELTHFFYGGVDGAAAALAERLSQRFPGLKIAGHFEPPIARDSRELPTAELKNAAADFNWIGLSTPKQEAFMAHLNNAPDVKSISLGVGAAFDFLTDRVRQAPRSIQRSGLEWLWRICQEPRRLGPRYLRTVPLFALRLLAQRTGLKTYPLD